MTEQTIGRLCAAVSGAAMMRHLEEFARRMKLSGTPDELESFRYLQSVLDGYGFHTELIRHDAFISLPGTARIEIGALTPDCITHSFSRSTAATGSVRGVVVYAGLGRAEDFAGLDVRGRVVLLESIANPAASLRASQAGAIGQIHISPHRHLHEMCISSVWGSPTEATFGQLPSTVVLSLRKADGDALKSRVLAGEAVEVVLQAEVDTGWRKTPILVAELAPPAATDAPFVMFSGHHDTWYYGVMDNGGANATMLEVARLFAQERAALRRGLRLCFWSGHSHGRYSGSTWYADNHWDELARRCVAHVNVDSTGAKGNTVMTDAVSSAELYRLGAEAVHAQGGQDLEGLRMSRAGDQSFWGIGVPSLFMGMGEQPAGSGDNVMGAVLGGATRKGAGFGWWWHTPDDTLDKMDADLLVRDTKVYVHACWRLLTDPVLPLDYRNAASALQRELAALVARLDGRFDLSPLTARATALAEAADAIQNAPAHALDQHAAERINAALIATSRALVPMDYTTGDRFDHDPALGQAPYPVLNAIRWLADAPIDTDQAKFATVAARRAVNRLGFALDEAIAALRSCGEIRP